MKKTVLCIIILTMILTGCAKAPVSTDSSPAEEGFAIYLSRDDISPAKLDMLSHIEIAEQPFIGADDIVSYNEQTHELKLAKSAFSRILALEVPTTGKTFVVCVDKSPVYAGALWTTVSSQSFEGITIWQPYSMAEPYIVTLETGYPSGADSGDDPRNKPEIIDALKNAGKLITALTISDVTALPASMKGYELYSWQQDDGWHFTLITGTNRNKTPEEITSDENYISETGWVNMHCVGEDALKTVLGKVPPGEYVSWCGGGFVPDSSDFSFPPQDIIDTIKNFALEQGLDFVAPV